MAANSVVTRVDNDSNAHDKGTPSWYGTVGGVDVAANSVVTRVDSAEGGQDVGNNDSDGFRTPRSFDGEISEST